MRTRLPQQCANLANGGSGARERNWFGPASFGTAVTLRREDGREQTFRIVGEDEADPAHGTISYVSFRPSPEQS
jgi:transcription elongation GreA/GreB family factor